MGRERGSPQLWGVGAELLSPSSRSEVLRKGGGSRAPPRLWSALPHSLVNTLARELSFLFSIYFDSVHIIFSSTRRMKALTSLALLLCLALGSFAQDFDQAEGIRIHHLFIARIQLCRFGSAWVGMKFIGTFVKLDIASPISSPHPPYRIL